MKLKYKAALIFLSLLTGLMACNDYDVLENIDDEPMIYLVQSTDFFIPKPMSLSTSAEEIIISAGLSGIGYAPNDITANFVVDEDTLAVINADLGSFGYTLLPSSAYTFSSTSATIPAGKVLSDAVKISVVTAGLDPTKTYALPVSVAGNENYPALNSNKTVVFLISGLGNSYAGSYASSGIKMSYDSLDSLIAEVPFENTKILSTISIDSVQINAIADMEPDQANSAFKLKTNADNSVSTSGYVFSVTNLIESIDGKQSSYDPDAKKFVLEYKYADTLQGTYHLISDTLILN